MVGVALGALALTGTAGANLDVAAPPPVRSAQLSVGRLAITLSAHEAFKLDTCTTAGTGNLGTNSTDTSTTSSTSPDTNATAITSISESYGIGEASTNNNTDNADTAALPVVDLVRPNIRADHEDSEESSSESLEPGGWLQPLPSVGVQVVGAFLPTQKDETTLSWVLTPLNFSETQTAAARHYMPGVGWVADEFVHRFSGLEFLVAERVAALDFYSEGNAAGHNASEESSSESSDYVADHGDSEESSNESSEPANPLAVNRIVGQIDTREDEEAARTHLTPTNISSTQTEGIPFYIPDVGWVDSESASTFRAELAGHQSAASIFRSFEVTNEINPLEFDLTEIPDSFIGLSHNDLSRNAGNYISNLYAGLPPREDPAALQLSETAGSEEMETEQRLGSKTYPENEISASASFNDDISNNNAAEDAVNAELSSAQIQFSDPYAGTPDYEAMSIAALERFEYDNVVADFNNNNAAAVGTSNDAGSNNNN
ncbi:hypothetical protein [Mycobacterium attenuatum]|uniref:hypothetical protein n=1 Tax=Mycobacterium attenuatum TaxID=2341086 RepID=UPI000F028155|nr:hypothetical protein [Mycobacterium attenuatum]